MLGGGSFTGEVRGFVHCERSEVKTIIDCVYFVCYCWGNTEQLLPCVYTSSQLHGAEGQLFLLPSPSLVFVVVEFGRVKS